MCFERSTASGWELTAPDRSDNSHTLSARWLDSAAHCKIRLQTCRGAGAGTAGRHRGESGWRGEEVCARIGCLPVAGWLVQEGSWGG